MGKMASKQRIFLQNILSETGLFMSGVMSLGRLLTLILSKLGK
jgi:hypothetical protein